VASGKNKSGVRFRTPLGSNSGPEAQPFLPFFGAFFVAFFIAHFS
jgi:hypothetical protein